MTYVDTSFLVSLYVRDIRSTEAIGLMASHPRPWLTPLHRAEWAHAIERQVFQKLLSRREGREVHAQFEKDCDDGVWVKVALPEQAFELCAQLARRHAARLGIRTLDTLHVASALELKAGRFWTFDERQARLARAAGLKLK
jgi:predicted nucleic acid-binding protein